MAEVNLKLTPAQLRVVNEALALYQAEVDGNERDYDRPNALLALIERTRAKVHEARAQVANP